MRKKNFFYSVFAVVLSFAISGAALAQDGNQPFLRGDSNADASVDLSDAIFSLRYLFQGGDAPQRPHEVVALVGSRLVGPNLPRG